MRKWIILVVAFLATPAGAQVTITTSPNPTLSSVGATFDVAVVAQAGSQQVQVASAYIDFDTTKLQVQSITPGTSLPIVVSNSYDNVAGQVNYSAFTTAGTKPSGTFTLYTIRFGTISAGSSFLTFHLVSPRVTTAGFGGVPVFSGAQNGLVTISAVANTPTFTPTGPPAATPTPAPAPACCGDCNGNGLVSTAERDTCNNIYAGTQPWADCPACDCDGNGTVTAAEVTTAYSHAAYGCPSSATPIPGQPWTMNPLNSEGFALGRLNCRASGTQVACLNTTVLTADPSTPRAGDIWITENGGTHELCWADSAGAHCVAP